MQFLIGVGWTLLWALIILAFIVWYNHPRLPQQTCHIYCPGCRKDLISQEGAFLYDEAGENAADNDVAYCCTLCGTESHWNFDLFPVPILRDAQPKDPTDAS